ASPETARLSSKGGSITNPWRMRVPMIARFGAGIERFDDEAEAHEGQREDESADDPDTVHALGEPSADLGSHDDADGQRDDATGAVRESTRDEMHGGAHEGHHGEGEVRGGGGHVNGKVQQIDHDGHVDEAAPNPEQAREEPDEDAQDQGENEVVAPDMNRPRPVDHAPGVAEAPLVLARLVDGLHHEEAGDADEEHPDHEIEGPAGDAAGGERAEDGSRNGGHREEHAGTIVHALEPRIGEGSREGVEEHHGEGDAGNRVGAFARIDEEGEGNEDEAAPPADDGAD